MLETVVSTRGDNMNQATIFLPMLCQILLTLIVWIWMYVTRVRDIRNGQLDVQRLDTVQSAARVLTHTTPAENFSNLFELPVLFYCACLTLYALKLVNTDYLVLAVGFVVLRVVHSLIHCSYNRVMHRFSAYLLSSLLLWAMWLMLAKDIISRIFI